MISDNLISEVLGFKCSGYQELGDNNIIYPLVHYGWVKGIEQISNAKQYPKGINIYELAHKCKEWALSQGYSIKILYDNDKLRNFDDVLRFLLSIITRDGVTKFRVKNIPENEAIFKACEWIMEQTK